MTIKQVGVSSRYVLIVNHNADDAEPLAQQLIQQGYMASVVLDSATALNLIRSNLPDLILLELIMPDMSGCEVCQALKADQKTCHIPVIFLSASDNVMDRVTAFSVGGADFILKPFQIQDVLLRIRHQIHGMQMQESLHEQNQKLLKQNQQLYREISERDRALFERKQIESTLAQEKVFLRRISNRLSTLIGNLQTGILFEDESRRIVLVNQSFCSLFGINVSPQQLIGRDCGHVVRPIEMLSTEPELFAIRVQEILQQRRVVVAEEIQLVGDRTFERDYIPVFYEQEYQGHLWQYRDITARKAAERELSRKTKTLADFSTSLKHLHRLNMTNFDSLEAMVADYIQTGCSALAFSAGAIGRIQNETYTFIAVQSEFEHLVPNVTINLQDAFCGKVSESRATVAFRHVGALEEMRCHPLYRALKLESYLGTPIFVDGDLFGSLCFFSTQPRPQGFENHEHEIIELMAQSIGKFISVQQIEAKQRQAEEEVRLLLTLTQEIAIASDFDQALDTALRTLCEATGWIYGEVWLPNAEETVLECSPIWYCKRSQTSTDAVTSAERFRQTIAGVTLQRGEGVAGRIWESQQAEWMPDVSEFLRHSPSPPISHKLHASSSHFGLNAHFGVPIMITDDRGSPDDASPARAPRSRVLAILVFFTSTSYAQDERLAQLVSAVAAQLGIVLAQKQTEAELQALFRAMTDVVAVRDGSGRCLKVASTMPNLPQTVSEVVGKTLHESMPRAIADLVLDSIRTSLATRQTVELEYSLPIQGREIWLSARISPLSDKSVIVVARDITERKQVEQSLLQTIQEREAAEKSLQEAKEAALTEAARSSDASRTKSEFLASMSHELRTPLNAILGFTQLMARETSLNQTAREYLGIINRSGEHLLSLINDVLEMSKIEAGQIALATSSFDLYDLLQSLEEMLQLKAKSKGLELVFSCAPELPRYVQTDEGKLRQVLINLLGNAIKFTEAGRVTLRVAVHPGEPEAENGEVEGLSYPLDWPSTDGTTSAIALHFEVTDTGLGIAPHELESLFQPFVQARREYSQEGTGLGLPISRKFVQLMGGDIRVNSALDRGTQVQFSIRARVAHPAQVHTHQPTRRAIALRPEHAPPRILVVEDHPESRHLLVGLLQTLGFDVEAAVDGSAAIALWQRWQPHLVWMDMQMPIIDGFEATRTIRLEEASHAPTLDATVIIALTASAFEEDRAKVLAAGCNDFVRKPFREDVILEKITEYLGVQYVYEDVNNLGNEDCLNLRSELYGRTTSFAVESSAADTLDPLCLQVMPEDWIQQVHQAAVIGSDRQLLLLIEQIPSSHPSLIHALETYIKHFHFEQLITLTQPYLR